MYADMICDVMPPIPEDVSGSIHLAHHGDTGLDATDETAQANIEQLMVSMLDERDRVSETDVLMLHLALFSFCQLSKRLGATEQTLIDSQEKLVDIAKERDLLLGQLSENVPQVSLAMTNQYRSCCRTSCNEAS